MKTTTLLTLIALAFSAAVSLRAEERMRAGLWQIATMLDGNPAGHSSKTCYTPAMVEAGNAPAKSLREVTEKQITKSGQCTLKDFKLDGNKIQMTTVCGPKVSVVSSSFTGTTFDTVVKATTAGATTVMHMRGERIGDCK